RRRGSAFSSHLLVLDDDRNARTLNARPVEHKRRAGEISRDDRPGGEAAPSSLPRQMEAQIREGQAPAVVVSLAAGEELTSEAGAMTFVSGDIAMEVEMPGGLGGGLKRKLLAGESLFVTHYKANGPGSVGITGPFPGSIRQHELDGEIICEKHAYLAHHGEVAIESAF